MKILITSIGTLGDINPAIALGKELIKLQHEVSFAACASYESNALKAGMKFHLTGPVYDPNDPDLCQKIMHPTKTLYYVHQLLLNHEQIESSISDFENIIEEYDVVIGNIFSYAAKIACLKKNIPWMSLNLSPLCFFSHIDPPALYPFHVLHRLPRQISCFIYRFLFKAIFLTADFWGQEVFFAYRRHLGMSPQSLMLKAPFSKTQNLALFSKHFAPAQDDWTKPNTQLGFIDYSGESTKGLSPELLNFISNGDKPILFTFGSISIFKEDQFLPQILAYLKRTKTRAIITTGQKTRDRLQSTLPSYIHLCNFIPYIEAMPLMKMVVHQGGIGTTSIAMSSGIPQIIIPDYSDQYDNAFRAKRIGIADYIPLRKLQSSNLELKIEKILKDESYFTNAKQVKSMLTIERNELQQKLNEIFTAL